MDYKTLKSLEWDLVQKEIAAYCHSLYGKKITLEWDISSKQEARVDWHSQACMDLLHVWQEKQERLPVHLCELEPIHFTSLKRGAELNTELLLALVRMQENIKELQAWMNLEDFSQGALVKYFASWKLLPDWTSKGASLLNPLGEISDHASQDLLALRKLRVDLQNKITKVLQELLKNKHHIQNFQDDFITLREGRYVIPVKSDFKGRVDGIVHDVSQSEQTVFVEPREIVEINNQIKMVDREIKVEIAKILAKFLEATMPVLEDLEENFNILAKADRMQAACQWILNWSCHKESRELFCAPVSDQNAKVDFEALFHPLLVEREIIANDVHWQQALLLTGPNAGGKTVLLKAFGLALCFAKAGLPVAAKKAAFSISGNFWAILGDNQSLEKNVSTFSAHLLRIKELLQKGNEGDFLLIDEIASGTSPDQGQPLAQAVLEEFLNKKIFMLVTTHFGQLKEFALSEERFDLASMDFDHVNKKSTFRIKHGVAGDSSAFENALQCGLSEELVSRAREIKGDGSSRFNKALQNLELSQKNFESSQRDLDSLKEKMQKEKESFSKEKQSLKKEFEQELRIELQKQKEIFKQVKIDLSNKIDSLKSLKDSPALFNQLASETKKVSLKPEDSKELIRKKVSDFNDVIVGEHYYVTNLGLVEVVNKQSEKKIEIQAGALKSFVRFENIYKPLASELSQFKNMRSRVQKLSQRSFERSEPSQLPKSNKKVSVVCDMRGLMLDEAIQKLEGFLNQLSSGDVFSVTALHGVGTGVLRKGIRNYLNKERGDLCYRTGTWPGEGGDGVSIVERRD